MDRQRDGLPGIGRHIRYALESKHAQRTTRCLLRAKSGHYMLFA
jgi:hypothetical protein